MSSDIEPPDTTGPGANVFGQSILNRIKTAAELRGARPRNQRTHTGGNREPRFQEKSRDPVLLGDSLESLISRRGWKNQLSVAAVMGRWREIVGDNIAEHSEPVEFTDGTLVIQASSTAWASQLRLLSGQVLAAFAREVGEGVVNNIKVLGPTTRSFKRGAKSVPGRGPRDTWG